MGVQTRFYILCLVEILTVIGIVYCYGTNNMLRLIFLCWVNLSLNMETSRLLEKIKKLNGGKNDNN